MKTRLYLAMHWVMPRTKLPTPYRYKAQWVTRNGTKFYESTTCDTQEKARELALKWLSRHPQYEAGSKTSG